jgi:hypothetical protein
MSMSMNTPAEEKSMAQECGEKDWQPEKHSSGKRSLRVIIASGRRRMDGRDKQNSYG